MSDHDTTPTGDGSNHEHPGIECTIHALSMNGQTVLFDAADAERWIQSDTSVDLSETV